MSSWVDAYAATILNGLALGSVLFLIAIGLSLVFGTMDVMNLAHGTVSLIGAYVGVAMYDTTPSTGMFVLAVAFAAIVGFAAGCLLAAMTSPVRNHLRQALLTLGMALVGAELIREVFGAQVQSVPAPGFLSGTVAIFGNPYPIYRIAMIVAGAVIALVLYVVLERTRAGAIVRATVADRAMVEAIGIRTKLVLALVFGCGAALAAVGGLLAAPILGAQAGLDDQILLLALVIVVIGGLGSLRGALLGALVVGQVQTLGVILTGDFAPFLLFTALATVLLLKPQGLMPARTGVHA
ncbi:branched-chain amino acid ABC transporter permease [Pseudarthrobacter oxydans]|uniref:branched-chain amino acid ABC transporter permease n=1 Tax=Pseudarthrobacter oxydans TaxID=1671 RepID=UPI0037F7B306